MGCALLAAWCSASSSAPSGGAPAPSLGRRPSLRLGLALCPRAPLRRSALHTTRHSREGLQVALPSRRRSGLSLRVGGRGGALLRHEVQSRTGGNRRQVPPHQAREAASLCGAPQSLRRASAVGERHRCSRKGSATARHIFLGHHSPKYFLTAGHLRCLAGLVPWTVSVEGGEGREEGGEARRAPLPVGV